MPLTSPRFAGNQRLQDAAENKPPLKRHEKSDGVKLLQQALTDLGYEMSVSFSNGGPDGDFGDETYRVVKRFQTDQKIWSAERDGIAGKDTLMLLDQLFQGGMTDLEQKGLAKNLGYSMQAVNYVLRTARLKAANWDKYRGEVSWEAGTAPMDALDRSLYSRTRPQADKLFSKKTDGTTLDWYRIVADLVKRSRVGNCGENSILAFMFLYDMGVRPIDRMALDDAADHAFVVIGRSDGDPADWKNWGPSAVVCDSWAQGFRYGDKGIGTYPGSQFGQKMDGLVPGWASVESDYRVG